MKRYEIKYTLIVILIVSTVVFFLTAYSTNKEGVALYHDKDFFNGLLIEAHGMVLNTVLLGVLVLFFISKAEKKFLIQQLHNEIGYLRLLKTDEAKFKIKALVEQLNNSSFYKLDLHQCTLQKIDLLKIKNHRRQNPRYVLCRIKHNKFRFLRKSWGKNIFY